MTQCEVLEFLLYPYVPRKDTVPIAQSLLAEFGNLEHIFEASPDALAEIKGVTPFASLFISSIKDILARAGTEQFTKDVQITNYESACEYLLSYIGNETKEKLVALFFGAKGQLLSAKCVSEGNSGETKLNLPKITTIAVNLGATSMIVSHNHPSGDLTPSLEDISCTEMLDETLRAMGIRLWDHIIVGGGKCASIIRELRRNSLFSELKLAESKVEYYTES